MNRKNRKITAAAAVLMMSSAIKIIADEEERGAKKKRTVWVQPWLQLRPTEGACQKILLEFRDVEGQKKLLVNFLRMEEETFQYLLDLVTPIIAKQDTNMRKSIEPSQRLCVTLRFLATGDSYKSLSTLFRIAPSTIALFVPVVCDAIYTVLKQKYLSAPTTAVEWQDISAKFQDSWNFPHCIGAVDGKHINMVAPPNAGSTYYNYKGTHSIVLMAVADAQYKFIYLDVGCNGRVSDGGVFNKTTFAQAMNNDKLNLPPAIPLPGREMPVSFVLVADDAFALRANVMKPYPGRALSGHQRIFNYRLSRARRVVENAFGILSARFRVLRSAIQLDANKTKRVTLACCALHNFLIEKCSSYIAPTMVDRYDENGALIPGGWRREDLQVTDGGTEEMPTRWKTPMVNAIRDEYRDYFMTVDGELPWQYKHI